jgi:hypothetical protein
MLLRRFFDENGRRTALALRRRANQNKQVRVQMPATARQNTQRPEHRRRYPQKAASRRPETALN